MEWASSAADSIRLMCKHLLDLKKSCSTWISPELAELLAMISEKNSHEETKMDTASASSSLKRWDSTASNTSSVQFCSALCRCPDCLVPEEVLSSQKSSTSEAAQENVSAAPSKRGAIKTLMQKKPADKGKMKIQ
eukprot:2970291-Lingulodinium_polyedra.AAC.1